MADIKVTTSEGAPPDENQEQYIRTLAGDIATLQKGGKPDLAPLREVPKPNERLITASPVMPTSIPAPTSDLPAPFKQVDVPAPKALHENVPKTYAGDFTERMKEAHASTATVLAAEQDSRPAPLPAAPPTSSRGSRLYAIAGIVLVIVGVAGASIAYLRYQATLAPVLLTSGASAPIFVDDREEIIGSGAALLSAAEKSLSRPLASNTVRLLSVVNSVSTSSPQATVGNVFTALPLSAPAVLVRNVNTAGSMAGIVSAGNQQSVFFILSVSSYSNSFAAMLSWEKKMPRDLVKLFPPYPVAVSNVIATSTATTSPQATTTTGSQTSTPAGFVDAVVANHDVRVYRDAAGHDIILYGYWNQSTLVIARDAIAFAEILGRLASS